MSTVTPMKKAVKNPEHVYSQPPSKHTSLTAYTSEGYVHETKKSSPKHMPKVELTYRKTDGSSIRSLLDRQPSWKDNHLNQVQTYFEYPAIFKGRKYKSGYLEITNKKNESLFCFGTIVKYYWQFTEFVGKENGSFIDFSEINYPDLLFRYIHFSSIKIKLRDITSLLHDSTKIEVPKLQSRIISQLYKYPSNKTISILFGISITNGILPNPQILDYCMNWINDNVHEIIKLENVKYVTLLLLMHICTLDFLILPSESYFLSFILHWISINHYTQKRQVLKSIFKNIIWANVSKDVLNQAYRIIGYQFMDDFKREIETSVQLEYHDRLYTNIWTISPNLAKKLWGYTYFDSSVELLELLDNNDFLLLMICWKRYPNILKMKGYFTKIQLTYLIDLFNEGHFADLQHLDLSRNYFGNSLSKSFAGCLPRLTNLRYLNINYCFHSRDGLYAICSGLVHLSNLVELHIDFPSYYQSFEELPIAFQGRSNTYFAVGNPFINILTLSPYDAFELFTSLGQTSGTVSTPNLNLSFVQSEYKDVVEALYFSAVKLPTFRRLFIGLPLRTGVDSVDAPIDRNCTVINLLNKNGISKPSFLKFITNLPFYSNLKELNIGSVDMGPDLMMKFSIVLSYGFCELRMLSIIASGCDASVCPYLSRALPNLPHLEELYLATNSLGDVGFKLIIKSLPSCVHLTKLDIFNIGITDVVIDNFLKTILYALPNLSSLLFGLNNISESKKNDFMTQLSNRKWDALVPD